MSTKLPCIAIIVSDDMRHCRGFLKTYNLNPKCFKLVTSYEQLQGLDRNIPVIITYCNNPNYKYYEMADFIKERFSSIRIIDY